MAQDDKYESTNNSSSHGEKFQKEVALALFVGLWKNGSTFKLAYEMTKADKFDDIVMSDDVSKVMHLIQAKHADAKGDEVKYINLDALFPSGDKEKPTGDFSLYKYLRSYVKVNHEFKEEHKKMFYIFTNRDLNEDLNHTEWVEEIELREVNEFLCIPGVKHYKLTPTKKAIEELSSSMNKDITELRKAIEELFVSGKVSPILNKYSTPLQHVFTIDEDKRCKFSDHFDPKSTEFSVAKLYNMLQSEAFEVKEKEKIIHKNFLQKKSNSNVLPSYVSEAEVVAFFNDFTLSMCHPNDMQPVINGELRSWMKEWIQPDILGKLNKTKYFNSLMKCFTECIKHDGISMRRKLQKRDREECFQSITQEIEEDMKKYRSGEVENRYINRRISYEKNTKQIHIISSENSVLKGEISDSEFARELRGLFKDDQHILIVADPGMGKTNLLQFVAFTLQKQNDLYIYLVYSSDLVKKLNEIEKVSHFKDVLKILLAVISEDDCDVIKNAADQRDANGFSIVLVMDGIDEVPLNHIEKVFAMLEQLSLKKSIQIILSSRIVNVNNVNVKKKIKEHFPDVTSMFLEPFSEQDQLSYLRKMWKVENVTEQKFESYSKHLLNEFHSSIESTFCEISGLPLMISMLADIHSEKYRLFCASTVNDNGQFGLSEDTLSIVQLYEKVTKNCFRRKIEITCQCNARFDDATMESIIDGHTLEHQLLAMELLNIDGLANLLKHPRYQHMCDNFKGRCDRQSNKSILVKKVSDDIQFCHQSYGEYFVAKYLCDHIFTLQPKHVISILSGHDVIRKLAMMMLGDDKVYFEILNQLCDEECRIAMWACESGCLGMVSALEEKIGAFENTLSQRILSGIGFGEMDNFKKALAKYQDKCKTLHSAVKDGNVDMVKLLLSYKTDVNYRNARGRTLLHTAALNGKVNVTEVLLKSKPNLNEMDKEHRTALHLAAKNGHDEVVKLLLQRGAKINSRTTDGRTPFHFAAMKGHLNVVEIFRQNNLDLKEHDNQRWTALHFAVQNRHVAVVKYLIDNDVDTNFQTTELENPFELAIRIGNIDVIKLFDR